MKKAKRVLSVVLCLVMVLCAVSVMEATAVSSHILDIDWDLIGEVGYQTSSGPCAAYALAYCRTLIDGYSHSYSEYYKGGKCVWSDGNYGTVSGKTTQGMLKAMYNKLNNNSPVVAHLYSTSNTEHWVAVVGYQDVSDPNNLSMDNFLMIDPGTSRFKNLFPLSYSYRGYSLNEDYRYAYSLTNEQAAGPSITVDVPNGFYTIQSVKDPDKVLDIYQDSTADGANVQLYDNLGSKVQKFWIEKTDDYYTLKNVNAKKWLDISSPYDTDGCNIQLWESNTRTEQKWRFEDAGNGNVYIHSLYGIYVDTDGGNTYNGVNVETYHFDGTPSQQWKLIRTSGSDKESITEGVYLIRNVRNTSKVLDIYENSTENGANIQLYDDVNSTVQYFKVVKNGEYYSLQSVYSNKWLDIATPCDEDGCNIQLWFKNTEKEQKWTFEDAGSGNYYIRSLYGMYIDTDGGATSNNTNVETYHYDGSTSQQWKLERVYTVTYDANNGTGAPGQQYKRANSQVTLSSTKPTRTGYSFKYWSTTKNDASGSTRYNPGATYSGNADLTLYAIWQPATYQINYNYNGGTAGPTSQTKVHGQDLVLSTVIPSRVGYAFQNWNTKLNGTGTVYMPGDTYKANEAATLYAAWKTCTHTWNSGTVIDAATCSATGTKTYTCTVCGATKTETVVINSSNHVNTTNVAAIASTCTVKGYSAGVYCNDCKQYISGHQEQPLAAHQTELRNAREATCTAEGYTGDQYCTVCKQTISTGTTIGKKAHTLTTINKKDAGCTTAGYTGDQYCTTCKQTITKGSATAALGHTAPDGNGNCTRCGTHIKDVTPPQPQPNPNACKWCGQVHTGFFGKIVGFFHSILAIFKR